MRVPKFNIGLRPLLEKRKEKEKPLER